MEVMKVEYKKLENEILQISIKEQLKEAYVVNDNDLEYIEGEFAVFVKTNNLKKLYYLLLIYYMLEIMIQ